MRTHTVNRDADRAETTRIVSGLCMGLAIGCGMVPALAVLLAVFDEYGLYGCGACVATSCMLLACAVVARRWGM